MNEYVVLVQRAVKNFMNFYGLSADDVAKELHIARGTFYAKLSGYRAWTVQELNELNILGVRLPPFDGDRYRAEQAKKRMRG